MLVIAALANFLAALAHLGCMIYGAPWYRALGAGAVVITAVEAKKMQPMLLTGVIMAVLFIWSSYALSAAKLIPSLPFVKPVLLVISFAYIARGIIGLISPRFRAQFVGNSVAFWRTSSTICLIIGLIHLIGVYQLGF